VEDTVLSGIFEHKRDEVTKKWRKLHNEELNDLYSSPNMVWVIISTRTRWAGHVARMGRGEVYTEFWWGNQKERDYLEGSGVDGRIILRRISEVGCRGMDWIELAQDGTGGEHL
jgi:hypothetical protein